MTPLQPDQWEEIARISIPVCGALLSIIATLLLIIHYLKLYIRLMTQENNVLKKNIVVMVRNVENELDSRNGIVCERNQRHEGAD